MQRRGGFSPVELLVVMAVMGVVIVMIAANWQNLRLYSRRTSLSNLRPIGVAFFAYSGDNDMRLPQWVSDTNESSKWPAVAGGLSFGWAGVCRCRGPQ